MPDSTSDKGARGGLPVGDYGPPISFGKPRSGGPDWAKVGLIGLVTTLCSVLLLGGAYAGVVFFEARQLQRDAVDIDLANAPEGFAEVDLSDDDGADGDDADGATEADRTTILLVGSDSRSGLSREQLDQLGREDPRTNLTDTLILLQVDPETDGAVMLSFPRDLLVERCDGTTGRINQAYFIGEQQREGEGARCLVQTITTLTGITIDHYVRVDFVGFVTAVDALGGITFYVDQPLQDANAGLSIPEAGCVDFDGVKALQFVRARNLDNDFGRIARQQRFAREMIDKATSAGTLANPLRVTSLISSVSEVLETDTGFGISAMADLVTSVRNLSSGRVDARTVPAVIGTFGAASVVREVEGEADALYAAFRNGDLLPEDVGTDAGPLELSPSTAIPIQVLNGSGEDGIEEEAAEVLTALGYTVLETGVRENYPFENSVILHPSDYADDADLLSESIGGIGTNTQQSEDVVMTLVIGSSFDPADFAPEDAPADATVDDGDATGAPAPEPTQSEFVGATQSTIAC